MHYLKLCDVINGCGKTYPGDLDACPHCNAPSWAAGPAQVDPRDYAYDIETYVNAFTCRVIHIATDTRWRFEISDRIDQGDDFRTFMMQLKGCDARLVGYNNVGFDYPVLHFIMLTPGVTAREIYDKAMSIIRGNDKFGHIVWDRDQIVPQLDLFKIHHFDNVARATSLKALEVAMRMRNVEDLPFPVGTILTPEQIDVLHEYNDHDVVATCYFYARSQEQIKFRKELTQRYGRNFLNHNDTKIGKDYFIMELEKACIQCFDQTPNGRQPRQTIRPSINLGDVIFPYVRFERPEFERIRAYLAGKTITETKGVFTDLTATIDGLDYVFGVGGLHMSIPPSLVRSDEEFVVVDVDVASYYPNLAIKNRLFPAHLGEQFCVIYEDVYNQRKSHSKGTAPNAMLKLALNGVYGDSNNVYSPFYDPQYTMSITINGQLLLCMLVEQLIKTPGLTMVQCNTDGVTFRVPRRHLEHTRALCKWWEGVTGLSLEEAIYSRMFIRDVNNYIAEYATFDYLVDGKWIRKPAKDAKIDDQREIVGLTGGKLKRKGAYEYNLQWHQDPSALVVPKAAEAALVRGEDVRTFIMNHQDPFDFMLRAKVPRSNKLVMRWPEWDFDTELASIIRYFVATEGGTLVKLAPPTGEPGTWKRAAKVSDSYYNAVMREIAFYESIPFGDGTKREYDSAGTPWDERIHTKNRSKHEQREMGICVGWRVMECSNADHFDWKLVNYDYYVAETEKLLTMVK